MSETSDAELLRAARDSAAPFIDMLIDERTS
jgi:hypothetical protein